MKWTILHEFDKEPDYICNYIKARGEYIRNQLHTLD